jgi:hypothetical protein
MTLSSLFGGGSYGSYGSIGNGGTISDVYWLSPTNTNSADFRNVTSVPTIITGVHMINNGSSTSVSGGSLQLLNGVITSVTSSLRPIATGTNLEMMFAKQLYAGGAAGWNDFRTDFINPLYCPNGLSLSFYNSVSLEFIVFYKVL